MIGYVVAGVCVAGLLAAVIGGCCRKYTMKFDTNGVAFDEEIKDVKARRGQEISLPELSSSKHEFLGWFLDPACTEKFDGKMRGDVTLYAGWKKKKEKKQTPQPMNMSYTDYIMHNISFNIALDW